LRAKRKNTTERVPSFHLLLRDDFLSLLKPSSRPCQNLSDNDVLAQLLNLKALFLPQKWLLPLSY
jgi:hypothetical protein